MTEAFIDLSRINANYTLLSKRFCAYCVVKSDAYGHGLIPVARSLYGSGARRFAALEGRDALALLSRFRGVEVLLLQPQPDALLSPLVMRGAVFSVSEFSFAERLSKVAARLGKRARCHIALNSGMNRLGMSLSPDDGEMTLHAVSHILRMSPLLVEGVYSHLACRPYDAYTDLQERRFLAAVAEINAIRARLSLRTPLALHLSATANLSRAPVYPEGVSPRVRVGLSLYGYGAEGVLPAMSLSAPVLGVFVLRRGEGVGYGIEYVATEDTRTAVIGVGYADGLPRLHRGMAFYCGETLLPVLGRISMNHTVVALPKETELQRGDRVTVFDRDGASLTALCAATDTIPYEVLLMGNRAHRVYKK